MKIEAETLYEIGDLIEFCNQHYLDVPLFGRVSSVQVTFENDGAIFISYFVDNHHVGEIPQTRVCRLVEGAKVGQ